MEAIFSWVKSIVVFFLILTLIDEILPDSDYRKYIRLAGGMVLILIVFSPVLKLFNMTDSMDYYYQWESLKTAVAGSSLVSGEFDGEAADSRKNDWILSQYEENLGEQIAALVKNEGYGLDIVTVSVNEDDASAEFGQIQTITLEIYRLGDADAADFAGNAAAAGNTVSAGDFSDGAAPGGDSAEGDFDAAGGIEIAPVETVAPVSIDETAEAFSETGVSSIPSDEILALKKLLSGSYGVHMNQITIHVRGR